MASSAPSGRGDGDKPPESAPADSTGLDPPADPQRNGESPASPPAPPPPDDDDRSVMGMMEGPDDHRQARARRGKKRPIRVVLRRCPACEALRKMSHDERSPVRRCSACEERKKMREARRRIDPPDNRPSDGEFSPLSSAPAPSSGDGKPVTGLGMELPEPRVRALCETKRPLSARTGGCPACEARTEMLLDRWTWDWDYEKFGAGGGLLHEKRLDERERLLGEDHAKLAQLQGAQEPNSSATAGVDVLLEKMMRYERGVVQDFTELTRLLGPQEAGSNAAAGGGGPGGSHGELNHEAMYKLMSQIRERIQDTVDTAIPQLFSKEILYEPVKECVGRYPKWLEENKDKVKKEEYEQYEKQLDLMVNLTVVYDNEPENFSKIIKIMYKIGECGQPPSQIVTDISPGLHPSILGQLFPGMFELLHKVILRSFPEMK